MIFHDWNWQLKAFESTFVKYSYLRLLFLFVFFDVSTSEQVLYEWLMALILDGNSEIGAHVRNNLGIWSL